MDTHGLLYVGSFVCTSDSPASMRHALIGFIDMRLGKNPPAQVRNKLVSARWQAQKRHQVLNVIETCLSAEDFETNEALASLIAFFALSDITFEPAAVPQAQAFLTNQLRAYAGDRQAIENIRDLTQEVAKQLAVRQGFQPGWLWHSWNILQRAIWAIERCNSPLEAVLLLSAGCRPEADAQVAKLWFNWSPNVTQAIQCQISVLN